MNYTYPKHLVDLIELPLSEFVERAQIVSKKKSHPNYEPREVLKSNPQLANTTIEDCLGWFTDHPNLTPTLAKDIHDSWLQLAVQIFEAEDSSSYLKWKKEITYWLERSSKFEQLYRTFDNITSPFRNATGMGKKEFIKKTPSAHFCKRYNILLRQAKRLVEEIEEDIHEVMWPPELPGVDKLRDEQLVSNTNYI